MPLPAIATTPAEHKPNQVFCGVAAASTKLLLIAAAIELLSTADQPVIDAVGSFKLPPGTSILRMRALLTHASMGESYVLAYLNQDGGWPGWSMYTVLQDKGQINIDLCRDMPLRSESGEFFFQFQANTVVDVSCWWEIQGNIEIDPPVPDDWVPS